MSTYLFATVFFAMDVCHCASLFCLTGLEEEEEEDIAAAPPVFLCDGILPLRCFSLSVLLDQSRKMRWRPDMLRLKRIREKEL